MKTTYKLLVLIAFFSFSNLSVAQTFDDDSTTLTNANTQTYQQNLFNTNTQEELDLNTVPTSTTNNIFIAQIGDNNEVVSNTKSFESNIAIIQNGNENNTFLNIDANKIEQTVIQNGNNNNILDYSPFQTLERNAVINQTGNNQNLTMFGNNTLSENIKISMQGQDQSIIIRNF